MKGIDSYGLPVTGLQGTRMGTEDSGTGNRTGTGMGFATGTGMDTGRGLLRILLCVGIVSSLCQGISALDSGKPAGSGYVAIDEHLGSTLPSNLVFTNEDSARVKLLDLIDRPTVIAPVYYDCPGLCTPIMDGMAELFNRSDLELGKDYLVFNN